MQKYIFDADPFSRAFLENGDKTTEERIALGLLEAAKYAEIDFPENCMLPTVEQMSEDAVTAYSFGSGIYWYPWKYDALTEKYPEHAKDFSEIKNLMSQFITAEIWKNSCSEKELALKDAGACWGGNWGGHGNPDYDRFLHLGTDGIRSLIEKYRKENPDKDYFYNACKTAMDSVDVVGEKIRKKAEENYSKETDSKKKAEWKKIADTFSVIPSKPAYDFYSAVMMFWAFFTLDGSDSPGRFDQFMIDYYRIGSKEENDEMLGRFLEAIHNVRGWNLCISGSDENFNDETNELSYAILDAVTKKGYQTPNLTMRVHEKTPDELWKSAAKCLGTGIGIPAIYNDCTVCTSLEKIGISPVDSHDYCMNGCNQIEIMGKSHMGLEDGEVNFGKALEFALHRGRNMKSKEHELLTYESEDPCECKTFGEFLSLFYGQLDYLTDSSARMANISQETYALYAPDPRRSCLIQGCIEKGKDYKNGGPLYGHGQILAEGIADAADSLYAIKTLIFDSKKYGMDELIRALTANYKNFERLHFDFSRCNKFGNDIPEVDSLCAEITEHFLLYCKTKPTFRGGIFTGGCSPYNRAAYNGDSVAALPNGKLDGESLYADSIAATPGNDTNGPTASVKSMLKYNQKEACSGFVAQMKFDKTLFNSEKGQKGFISLAKAYFSNGGQQLSVNVLDADELRRAQKEPEKYRNLIVRVGGYSDYFCNLSPELQQNIIDRTEFKL